MYSNTPWHTWAPMICGLRDTDCWLFTLLWDKTVLLGFDPNLTCLSGSRWPEWLLSRLLAIQPTLACQIYDLRQAVHPFLHFWGTKMTKFFFKRLESTLRWRFGWFLTIFVSNKSLPLPPGPLIWTPMDLSDLEHVVRGLIKLWEAHKLL